MAHKRKIDFEADPFDSDRKASDGGLRKGSKKQRIEDSDDLSQVSAGKSEGLSFASTQLWILISWIAPVGKSSKESKSNDNNTAASAANQLGIAMMKFLAKEAK